MRRGTKLLLAASVLVFGPAAFASDPVKYQVKFTPSHDGELDSLLRQTSSLVALGKKLPPAPFALIGRARADEEQFLVVLHSLGYDAGNVEITIDGDGLDDPALVDRLTQAASGQIVTVEIIPHQGGVFHLGVVATPGLPANFTVPVALHPGDVARAAPILAQTGLLRTALHNAGYAFASVSAPLAVAEPAARRLDVTYTIVAGPRVNIGPVSFEGLTRTKAGFLRRHIALQPGQKYSDTAIQAARDSLLGLGVFTSITPLPQQRMVHGDQVPILFRVQQQKRHAVTLSLSYATDVGFTVSTSWEDRDLFTHAETLTITAAANGLGGTGATAPGYDLKGVFTKPDFAARGQELSASLEGQKESLTAYDRTALLAALALSRPITPKLSITYGPGFVSEHVLQEGTGRDYVLLQFPVNFTYDTADSVLEPTHGIDASLSFTPTEPVVGDRHPFIITQLSTSIYLPVEHEARGIIALRGQIGSIQGTSQFDVPPDQRFYAGGSGTVRGYTYQTIGPLFADDNPEGGLAFDAVNLEFRQRIGQNFGIVPFVDAGQVNANGAPFQGILRIGAGLGARYYTSIGPIRLDVAVPMTRVAGSGAFALYIGLGEAF